MLEGMEGFKVEKVESFGLQGVYEELAHIIGLELTINVFETLKGQQITFPSRLYEREYVIKEVKRRYNGTNLKELAREFNYTERWIRELMKTG
ncbi:hypothetical protein C809_00941 [Lachnospiraceae bacterium MD335]|jgi:Mor family transcriptional regulator|nr:hypothetical protein C809_00941 [Lachnospiraceae bacterium MD335]